MFYVYEEITVLLINGLFYYTGAILVITTTDAMVPTALSV